MAGRALGLVLCCMALRPVVGLAAQPAPSIQEYSLVPIVAGSRPEGVTAGSSNDLWVACLSGRVLHVDLAMNTSTVVHSEPGVALSGAKFCTQQQILFAAGSLSGKGYIYHMQRVNSGATRQQEYTVAKRRVVSLYNKPGLAYINDVAISQDRVYFTDSFHPVIYSIGRQQGSDMETSDHVLQHYTGEYFDTKLGQFRANGLAVQSSSRENDTLVVANTHTGNLYRVVIDKVPEDVPKVQQQQQQQQQPEQQQWQRQEQQQQGRVVAGTAADKQHSFSLPSVKVRFEVEGYSPAGDQGGTVQHEVAVQELVLPKVSGKVSDTLLLDGVWFTNSSFAFVADNYNNRVWGVDFAADASCAEIRCLIQLPMFGVPTTITSVNGKLWITNAHLDTCFPFLPCPLHEFEVIGVEPSQCHSWP